MADKKISALTAASTPLAGSEVLPIVQSGSTVKVSVSNLTAGRAVSASSLEAVGNGDLVTIKYASDGGSALLEWAKSDNTTLWTVGGGVVERQDELAFRRGSTNVFYLDNSNNVRVPTGNLVIGTAGKGIDFSANGGDVLSQYDEGTWAVQLFDAATGGNASATTVTGYYTRVGRMVTATFGGLDAISTAGMNASGYLYVTLPFTANSSAGYSGALVATSSINFGVGYTYCVPNVNLNSNRAPFGVYGSAVGANALLVSALTSGVSGISRFSVTYFV